MSFEGALQFAVLVLAVANGLLLFRVHVRDRARLAVVPIAPESYQWWYRLGEGRAKGSRRYGLLAYVSILNRGYRAVNVESWRLYVRCRNGQSLSLEPISIAEPTYDLGKLKKVFPVLGISGASHKSDIRPEPGGEVSGMAFYVCESHGGPEYDPLVTNGVIAAELRVQDVYGGRTKAVFRFRERSPEELHSFIPGVADLLRQEVPPSAETAG